MKSIKEELLREMVLVVGKVAPYWLAEVWWQWAPYWLVTVWWQWAPLCSWAGEGIVVFWNHRAIMSLNSNYMRDLCRGEVVCFLWVRNLAIDLCLARKAIKSFSILQLRLCVPHVDRPSETVWPIFTTFRETLSEERHKLYLVTGHELRAVTGWCQGNSWERIALGSLQ